MSNGVVDAFPYAIDTVAYSPDRVPHHRASGLDGAGDRGGNSVVDCPHYPARRHDDSGLVLLGQILELRWGSLGSGCCGGLGVGVRGLDLLNS